jgi:hypothetical protein
MHFIFKITLLKHNHSSKTFDFLCPFATLHVSVINLDHHQGYCSCCNATVRQQADRTIPLMMVKVNDRNM